MNLKYKKYPILKHISAFRKSKEIAISFSLKYDNTSLYEDSLSALSNYLKSSKIYFFQKDLFQKIVNREFRFMEKLNTFLEQDLSDKGILIVDDFAIVYEIFSDNSFQIFGLTCIYDSVYCMYHTYGTINAKLNKFETNYHLSTILDDKHLIEQFTYQLKEAIQNIFECVIFKKYAPIETKTIKAGKGIKSIKKKNSDNIDVVYVDSSWFTNLIRTGAFKVKGHFALRACGKGRSERKLVWINPYEKNGYTRKAKLALS